MSLFTPEGMLLQVFCYFFHEIRQLSQSWLYRTGKFKAKKTFWESWKSEFFRLKLFCIN